MSIPAPWRERSPAMTPGAWKGLSRILQHPDAPRWNREIGDRAGEAELEALATYRERVATEPLEAESAPSDAMTARIDGLRDRLFHLEHLPLGFDTARDFVELPTTSREDIVRRLVDLVPHDADLEPAIVYTTSGTTGHPVVVPTHPGAMLQNLAHLERIATLHGIALTPTEGVPHVLNISAQQRTYVFATSMSGWDGATFAKINLSDHDWAGGPGARRRFLEGFAPQIVASEPVTMAELIRQGAPIRPQMVISSAVDLAPEHAAAVEQALGTRVVDLYSATETGPIAATVPGIRGHVVLLPDVFIEVLDPLGQPLADGERGEITVTGGRNPFLPLVRYRTGDFGRLTTVALPDGTRARCILDLEGRPPVSFEAVDGSRVSSVDIARSIRPVGPFVQHQLVQRADRSVELKLRPIPNIPIPLEGMEHALRQLFGRDAALSVTLDDTLGTGTGKVRCWIREGA